MRVFEGIRGPKGFRGSRAEATLEGKPGAVVGTPRCSTRSAT